MWIGRRFNRVKHLHVANVVEVDLIFQYHYQTFAVQADGENARWKGELAYCRVPLLSVSKLTGHPVRFNPLSAVPLCFVCEEVAATGSGQQGRWKRAFP